MWCIDLQVKELDAKSRVLSELTTTLQREERARAAAQQEATALRAHLQTLERELRNAQVTGYSKGFEQEQVQPAAKQSPVHQTPLNCSLFFLVFVNSAASEDIPADCGVWSIICFLASAFCCIGWVCRLRCQASMTTGCGHQTPTMLPVQH
jgi:hypothetical protein